VSLLVKKADNTTLTYTYAGDTVTKDSTGVYSKDVPLADEGNWWFGWAGTGACDAIDEDAFTFVSSQFV
jgi:hypothetical protein